MVNVCIIYVTLVTKAYALENTLNSDGYAVRNTIILDVYECAKLPRVPALWIIIVTIKK